MKTPLETFSKLDKAQIFAMIEHTTRSYPFLELSSTEGVAYLVSLMIETPCTLDNKPTPICSMYSFLREVARDRAERGEGRNITFADRDFVFCIKMFGLGLQKAKNGIVQFVTSDVLENSGVRGVLITDQNQAKRIEVYVSSIHRHTKIQTTSIESATNKLLRVNRDVELAKMFVKLIKVDGMTIGQAKDVLRDRCSVRDHEYIRIRQQALDNGWIESKRSSSREKRVSIDQDNLDFLESTAKAEGKGVAVFSLNKAVNKALRHLRILTQNR